MKIRDGMIVIVENGQPILTEEEKLMLKDIIRGKFRKCIDESIGKSVSKHLYPRKEVHRFMGDIETEQRLQEGTE